MDKLPCTHDAAFDSYLWEQQPRCLPNTRVAILKTVDEWSHNPTSPCIFWLRGMAGTGKSTIARTVAKMFADQGQLGASFFFSRGRGDLGYAKKLFTTVAAQLASSSLDLPGPLRHYISKAIADNPLIVQKGLVEQWKHLIFTPLTKLEEKASQQQAFQQYTLMFVIDALDECDKQDDVRLLLRLLSEIRVLQRVKVRVFVTSRPETSICSAFLRQMPKDTHQDVALHHIDAAITQHDIYIFLLNEFQNIRDDNNIEQSWPSDHDIQLLANKASGLFIYAATACRFIRNEKYSSHAESLERFLLADSTTSDSEPYADLYNMYTQILQCSILGESDEQRREKHVLKFKEIAGPLVVLFESLTPSTLSKLIGFQEGIVHAILRDLHSVLDISDSCPIRLLHPSFRDFLLCHSGPFYIDEHMAHGQITTYCLKVMASQLTKDICNLKAPGVLYKSISTEQKDQHISLELRYACRYWVDHFIKSKVPSNDGDSICCFLDKHLLHWLEVCSLIGMMPEAVLGISTLEGMVRVCNNVRFFNVAHDLLLTHNIDLQHS